MQREVKAREEIKAEINRRIALMPPVIAEGMSIEVIGIYRHPAEEGSGYTWSVGGIKGYPGVHRQAISDIVVELQQKWDLTE
jgi:hypothetical protein